MPTRRRVLAVAGTLAVAGCSGDSEDTTTTAPSSVAPGGGLAFSTPAFEDGGTIPEKYTGDREDLSPPLTIESVPDDAETLALVVDDPDAPGGTFVHWLIWNVPADVADIPEGIEQQETVDALDGASQGTNDFDELGYRGPLPPSSHDAHTYRFTMSAVDTTLDLSPGATQSDLADALDGHRIDTARITGEYDR